MTDEDDVTPQQTLRCECGNSLAHVFHSGRDVDNLFAYDENRLKSIPASPHLPRSGRRVTPILALTATASLAVYRDAKRGAISHIDLRDFGPRMPIEVPRGDDYC
jgi:hypothetical protein